MFRNCAALKLLLLLSVDAIVCAEEWPRFRGPEGNGHATGHIPVQWSEEQNVTWRVDVPGQGHSSPVVASGQIWLTTAITTALPEEEKKKRLAEAINPKELNLVGELSLRAVCYDQQSGQLVHDVEVFSPKTPEPIHYTNTYASPTPVLEAGRVFVHFGTYGSAAIDATSGKVLWRNSELKVDHQNGPGSSPVIWQKRMIVHFDGIDRQFIAAFNTDDGTIAWKTDRSGEMDPKPPMKKAYCTPTIIETDSGPEVISAAADWVYGYDPSTGSEKWKARYGELGFSTVPCPIVGHNMAYLCTSFSKSKLLAIKLGGKGDVSSSHIAWTSDSQIPNKPSLLLVGAELFVCNDTGIVTCFDALDGSELWRSRVAGNFSASPLFANGLIYLFDQDGKTTVIRAGRSYEVVAENYLSEGCNASAAVAGDSLLVRTATRLYRLDN